MSNCSSARRIFKQSELDMTLLDLTIIYVISWLVCSAKLHISKKHFNASDINTVQGIILIPVVNTALAILAILGFVFEITSVERD